MKTPQFWKSRALPAKLLLPVSWLYEAAYLTRRAFTVQTKFSVPVVCIGNITAGGSGKTPLALYVGEKLKERGVNAYFISRGYGGQAPGPLLVKPEKHRSFEVGDEPLLLAQMLPTVVGKDRLQAAQFAIKKGAKLLILDDGFQNKKIFKDFSFLVMDGTVGFGNGLLLPAGPLRERFSYAIKRAHALVAINPRMLPVTPEATPVFLARTQVTGLAERLRGQKIVAFCGIAFPEKFQATLTSLGARVVEFKAFADHEPYRHDSLLPLAQLASQEKAYLVTTRKDFVRLPRGFKDKVVVVDIALDFEKPEEFSHQLNYIAGLV